MKKLVFTALAVVVFSGVAMANNNNNINPKKIDIDSINDVKDEFVFGNREDEQAAATAECISNGCSYWEAYFFGAAVWGDCMS